MRMTTPVYKILSLTMAAVFAAVGLLFLLWPGAPVRFLNAPGRGLGFPEAPLPETGFYLGLAVGFMYVVTLLAFLMFRNPSVRAFPFLLAQAKGASSLLSFGLFVFHRPYFIYLANGLVDLGLCLLAVALLRSLKRRDAAAS